MMRQMNGEWLAAEQENKALRDRLRQRFWSDVGIVPASDNDEIDITAESRVDHLRSLFERTINGKETDSEFRRIADIGMAEVDAIALGSLPATMQIVVPTMVSMAPNALRSFFLTQEKTTFEWNESGGGR